MLFNSVAFLFFLLIFFAFWPFMVRSDSRRWIYIILMSFLFYGWWDWRYLFVLIATGLIDYAAGIGIEAIPRFRRIFLCLSITANLPAHLPSSNTGALFFQIFYSFCILRACRPTNLSLYMFCRSELVFTHLRL